MKDFDLNDLFLTCVFFCVISLFWAPIGGLRFRLAGDLSPAEPATPAPVLSSPIVSPSSIEEAAIRPAPSREETPERVIASIRLEDELRPAEDSVPEEVADDGWEAVELVRSDEEGSSYQFYELGTRLRTIRRKIANRIKKPVRKSGQSQAPIEASFRSFP